MKPAPSVASFETSMIDCGLGLVALLAAGVSPASAAPPASSWAAAAYPTNGPAIVFGSHGRACLSGAVPLPPEGVGYQAVDLPRRRHFGHPVLLAFITELGQVVAGRQLGTMLVGDMAQARGGPMSSGHVSHQGGLDVDIWFRLDVPPLPREKRDEIPQPSVVDPQTGQPDPDRWGISHAELIRAAAQDPRVSRVFVGAAIKRDLCGRTWIDRRWLHKVRPWPGHDDHLHVRLSCPPGSRTCVDQPPLPDGEGCDAAELAQAFAHERAWKRLPPPVPNRDVPAACRRVLADRR
jgi:penicillin-insensitive murein endopeptidase